MIVHEWSADTTDVEEEGRRFGAAWTTQLRAARDSYLELFAQSGVADPAARKTADDCRRMTEEYAPEIAAEFRGMAAGSALALEDIWLLTARTEILALTTPSMECSTIVHIPDGAPPRTLQTWDWHETLSNETVVRRLRTTTGTGIVTFCEFGQPAKIGVNDRGLGLHFNILHHLTDGKQPGVPVHVLARMILERARTIEEATQIARSVPLAASSVLTVATFDGERADAAAIEVAPGGIAVVRAPDGRTLVHTNHFLDVDLAAGEYSPYETTTLPRYRCLVDAAELAGIAADRDRALAFGAIPDAPITVRARRDQPPHLRWETKLTATLDVAGAALSFVAGAPADVATSQWRRLAVARKALSE
ncbi:MAG: C45 family autoproteolytic acyltransferase/hydrolase [Microbacterium sp.]|uniref:C45 family autoproteolytic acyltransferase/hydolase n=1 Tax=Microbacterium gubbeenense TaxID=159896 RepID=UPI003F9D6F82